MLKTLLYSHWQRWTIMAGGQTWSPDQKPHGEFGGVPDMFAERTWKHDGQWQGQQGSWSCFLDSILTVFYLLFFWFPYILVILCVSGCLFGGLNLYFAFRYLFKASHLPKQDQRSLVSSRLNVHARQPATSLTSDMFFTLTQPWPYMIMIFWYSITNASKCEFYRSLWNVITWEHVGNGAPTDSNLSRRLISSVPTILATATRTRHDGCSPSCPKAVDHSWGALIGYPPDCRNQWSGTNDIKL